MTIRKVGGKYRIESKSGKRRNLGTFDTEEQAKRHERQINYFKQRRRGKK